MPTQSSTSSGSSYQRIDTEHHLMEMMQTAVSRIHSGNIQIRLQEEAIMMTGSVDCWYEKQHPQEILRELSGGRRIHNELHVTAH